MPHPTALYRDVTAAAADLQFSLLGVTDAVPSTRGAYIHDWLAAGRHGEMSYLAKNLDARLDPVKLLPGAASIICVADRYAGSNGTSVPGAAPAHPSGRIARYAWGDDYHKVMKKRLHVLADRLRDRWPGHQYKTTVDTAPLLEREHAQRAGIGWIGKHTLVINPKQGSWLLLGALVTTLRIDLTEAQPSPMADHCGTCTRCIDACPTACIEPYRLDASRCVSYLTLEHRSAITPDLHGQMGDWIAGCDVCQQVCPFNSASSGDTDDPVEKADARPPILPQYTPRPPAPSLGLLEVLSWDAEDRRVAFRGSALKRIKLDMLKRNALIAAGNYLCTNQDAALEAQVRQLADDQDQPHVLRVTANDVLQRIAAERHERR